MLLYSLATKTNASAKITVEPDVEDMDNRFRASAKLLQIQNKPSRGSLLLHKK